MDWTLQFLLNYTFWESFGHLVDFAALYWIEQVTNPAADQTCHRSLSVTVTDMTAGAIN